ncbi:MAG: metallophosphoesterase [Alphaproteobacteria bacterium]|uniref:Putative calcineurin-like phosphoesterase n=1 Tax=viral metagenome TaxID=1070528 RepID=A0A6M3Y2B2_9ZZZZ|nr:metallophosphoesterase [Alphaproteobacteria bacterium]MBU1561519.1 metallophosphoesterase [Alphaproteobacteria bacterium]MBU2300958.1 metallophosphoesterase [Alphaproteobacteria bacterium]MBU2368409.1 metallophosphoesterase [Alphaproteobacteria bacterium]
MKRPQHVFFTSDQHFGHRAIIEMCSRPFVDVDDMDRSMIQAWNSVVRPGDVVWHLGDFAHRCPVPRTETIFHALNGTKHLILGNHDRQSTTRLPWASQSAFHHLVENKLQVNLSHYGFRVWPGLHRQALMLYGHSHSTLPGSRTTIDVGVDNVGYVPQTLAQLQARMALLPRLAFDIGRDLGEPDEPVAEGGFRP